MREVIDNVKKVLYNYNIMKIKEKRKNKRDEKHTQAKPLQPVHTSALKVAYARLAYSFCVYYLLYKK